MYSKVLNLHQPKNQLPSKCEYTYLVICKNTSPLSFLKLYLYCVSIFSVEDSANGEPAVSAGVGEEWTWLPVWRHSAHSYIPT